MNEGQHEIWDNASHGYENNRALQADVALSRRCFVWHAFSCIKSELSYPRPFRSWWVSFKTKRIGANRPLWRAGHKPDGKLLAHFLNPQTITSAFHRCLHRSGWKRTNIASRPRHMGKLFAGKVEPLFSTIWAAEFTRKNGATNRARLTFMEKDASQSRMRALKWSRDQYFILAPCCMEGADQEEKLA